MNILIFFLHIGVVMAVVLGAVRLGKEALVAMVALLAVIANLFVLKQVNLFGLAVTSSDVYIIGSMLGLNLLQEFWGREIVQKAIWISFFGLLLFGVMSQFQLFYLPNAFDETHGAFAQLLSVQPRLLVASLTAYLVSQQLDMRLFGWLKKGGLPLAVRSGITLVTCQVIDTLLFGVLGLYGIVGSLVSIMAVAFTVKVTIIICMTPFTEWTKRVAHVQV